VIDISDESMDTAYEAMNTSNESSDISDETMDIPNETLETSDKPTTTTTIDIIQKTLNISNNSKIKVTIEISNEAVDISNKNIDISTGTEDDMEPVHQDYTVEEQDKYHNDALGYRQGFWEQLLRKWEGELTDPREELTHQPHNHENLPDSGQGAASDSRSKDSPDMVEEDTAITEAFSQLTISEWPEPMVL
jgi:hypothetical protein